MADRKSPEQENEVAESSGGSKKKSLVVMGLIAIVIAGVAYVLGGRSSGADPAAEPVATVPELTPAETLGEIVELDPLNVNLAGGHYLRVGIAIGITSVDEEGAAAHSSADATTPSIATAPAADLVVSTFAGRDMEVLATAEGREAARRDLHTSLTGFYGEEIASVLFTEFVMQ